MSESVHDLLRGSFLLEGVPEETIARIASAAQRIEFAAGTIIFREGEPAENIYLITSGTISLEICAPSVGCRRILTVGAGELLSWSPLLENEKLTATARAIAPATAVRIGGNAILELCERDVEFGYNFMRRVTRILANRLSATRLQLLNIYGTSE